MSCDNLQNIKRYWVSTHSGIVIREWNNEEYQKLDPTTRIYECVIQQQCEHCGELLYMCFIDKGHLFCQVCYENKYKKIKYANHYKALIELVCLEVGEKQIDDKLCSYCTRY